MQRHRLSRTVVLASLAVATVGIASCGDDDGGSASSEFCDGLVQFNEAATSVDVDEQSSTAEVQDAGEELSPIWDRVRNNAPDDLDDDLAPISDAIDALGEGDAEPFGSDETFVAYTEFVSAAVEQCDFDTTEVTAVDYAFEDVPETVSAGTVAIRLTNEAESEDHEFIAFRKNDPDQSADEIFELPEEDLEEAVTFGGAVSAPAGESATSLFNLEPGRYVAVCFVPVGGDEDAPPHFAEGMFVEFTVT